MSKITKKAKTKNVATDLYFELKDLFEDMTKGYVCNDRLEQLRNKHSQIRENVEVLEKLKSEGKW